jgi:hypothetical protein
MHLRYYLQQANNWKGNITDQIWWELHDSALKSMSHKKRLFIHKFIYNRLASNERQHKYHSYLSSISTKCNIEIKTQHHIFLCKSCPTREKLKNKYLLELNCIMKKHQTNTETKTIISTNFSEWLKNQNYIKATSIAPDASKTLIKATKDQKIIGWDNWIKGRWSKEWGTLQNYDVMSVDSGIKHNTAEKWANVLIILTWEFIHSMWLERNNCEHDMLGNLEIRKKEKLIEFIVGESRNMDYQEYPQEEIDKELLLQLPKENLQLIEITLKNARKSKRKKYTNLIYTLMTI